MRSRPRPPRGWAPGPRGTPRTTAPPAVRAAAGSHGQPGRGCAGRGHGTVLLPLRRWRQGRDGPAPAGKAGGRRWQRSSRGGNNGSSSGGGGRLRRRRRRRGRSRSGKCSKLRARGTAGRRWTGVVVEGGGNLGTPIVRGIAAVAPAAGLRRRRRTPWPRTP